jgi:opacity protein-like surface antigen
VRRLILAAVTAALLTGAVALPSAADAKPPVCPAGYFCVTTDSEFNGYQRNWYGDDDYWESNVNNKDSSWGNHGVTGPGIPASVQVYDGFFYTGAKTICLNPTTYVFYNEAANDRGSSHKWVKSC